MDKAAIERSKASLATAEATLPTINLAQSLKEFDAAWAQFLMSTSRIYTQLEQGAKINNKSIGWFAKKKGERRADPLLYYMWFARNAEEHGLDDVTAKESGSIRITAGPTGSVGINLPAGKPIEIVHLRGAGSSVEVEPGSVKLTSVKARDGEIIVPPTSHKGQQLSDNSPFAVANLFLAYVKAMLQEAERLT